MSVVHFPRFILLYVLLYLILCLTFSFDPLEEMLLLICSMHLGPSMCPVWRLYNKYRIELV